MLLLHEIRLPISASPEEAVQKALARLKIPASAVLSANIHKISVDARHTKPLFVYSVAVSLKDAQMEALVSRKNAAIQLVRPESFLLRLGKEKLPGPVVVCGFGPAGLFAAVELAKAGYQPIVLERGLSVEERRASIENFEQGGSFSPEGNIQFGEGGAGTFSDGKLTTRIKDPLCARVTQHLLDAGAPQEIAYKSKPHIGTDLLQGVIVRLRQKVLQDGGTVEFNTKLTGIVYDAKGQITAVETNKGAMPCGLLILAVGHSARDTFFSLHENGLEFISKPFSIGFRIEHLQSEIDKGLYHDAAGHAALPPGEYQLSTKVGNRGVYTFCMCPGGSVVAAQSEEHTVVTNGMSCHARAGANANAAIVANVSSADYGTNPFDGIRFQQQLEKAAYQAGGGDYSAPAETVGSYLSNSGKLDIKRVNPTYSRGVVPASLGTLIPKPVAEAIATALPVFGRKLPGFSAEDTVLTGLETRTSSPIRIPRDEELESMAVRGVYPCGEGAGYAGGIMSAAVDGVRVAKKIIERYAPV